MNLTAWLDVAIGLGVIYLGTSLFVTTINESIAQVRNLRGKGLVESLEKIIGDPQIRHFLKEIPALAEFFNGDKRRAGSHVDPALLARMLIGGLAGSATASASYNKIVAAINNIGDASLKRQLQAIVRTAEATKESLVTEVTLWLDRSLSQLGEWYKRHMQFIGFVIGLLVAVVLNLDTIAIVGHLYKDKEARDAAAAIGVQIAEKTDAETFDYCLKDNAAALKEDRCQPLAGLVKTVRNRNATLGSPPIGWGAIVSGKDASGSADSEWLDAIFEWLSRVFGWLLTGLAVAMGAPFWFDLLNKLVGIRPGGAMPEKR